MLMMMMMTYVCMHAPKYVCVCLYGWMDVQYVHMYVFMNTCRHTRMLTRMTDQCTAEIDQQNRWSVSIRTDLIPFCFPVLQNNF